jgi:NAD-dependent DNA ligase
MGYCWGAFRVKIMNNYEIILALSDKSDSEFRSMSHDEIIAILNEVELFIDKSSSQITGIYQDDEISFGMARRQKGITVCFSGFSDVDKAHLRKLAHENGMNVVKSVVIGLCYLVVGGEPGKLKVEEAKRKDAKIITKEQFVNLISTGEIPSSADDSVIEE